MFPHTDDEWHDLPHVILTSGDTWNPTVLDNKLTAQEDWYNTLKDVHDGLIITPFDEYGNYRKRHVPDNVQVLPTVAEALDDTEVNLRDCFHIADNLNDRYVCFDTETGIDDNPEVEVKPAVEVKSKPIDYNRYRPYFLHAPIEKIRRTFQTTTQHATNIMSGHNIHQTIQSPFPAHNVWRRNEPVASDTIYAEVPAIASGGQTMAQIFVGRKSLVIDIYGMSTEKEFVNTLEDVIRKRGAMDKLITDSARVETSARVQEILRSLCIDDWQSEPNYQHQNFAEHRWGRFKSNINWFMNWRNVDEPAWLLCSQWISDVMNHTAERSLGWRPPLSVLTGQTIDISILLCFLFWDVVYVARYDDSQYSGQIGSKKSSEIRGRFVGFAWDVGHALTFKILTDDSRTVIHRSRVRLAKDGENNLKLDTEAGAIPERIYIKSKRDSINPDDVILPTINIASNPFTIEDDSPSGTPTTSTNPVRTASDSDSQPDDELPALRSRKGQEDYDSDSEDEDDDHSPMDDPPLRDQPVIETVADDDDEYAEKHTQPRATTHDYEPVTFHKRDFHTLNPTEQGLPPEEMIDRTFLMPPQQDGTRVRAKIIEMVNKHKRDLEDDPMKIKFKCLVNNDHEEVVAYNDIVDFIEQDQTWDGIWKFRQILDHQGPIRPSDKRYMGSRYNLLVEWETGECSWQPLTTTEKHGVYDTDPVTVAIYAQKHGLLNTSGWKLPGMKKLAKTQQRIIRRANQAKLHSFRTKPVYMYGFQVPRNHQQAAELDHANGNSLWREAELYELEKIHEYKSFIDKGKGYKPDKDYKKINVHFVYAVKHDGRHRARLVAGGHLTDTPIDSVYSSVVSLRGIRMLTFLAELNDLHVWSTDISSAYLESYTKEKVYIVAGPEFGELEGHTLIINKALYGLKSSGLRWHERFSDVLRHMGFFPCKAERDIWMRDKGDHYEYIGVYVDDLAIASKDAQSIIDHLTKTHNFNVKGTGPITFHLGCDFFRDEDGVLCYAPRKYIEKMLDNYRRIFGVKPRPVNSPLIKGDHPELDTSELLNDSWIKIYQSLIGALQWVIQIGRFDVATAVMTLSRFRVAPRQGHLERVKRVHGYLLKMKHGVIRIRTEEPDYSHIPEKEHDWSHSCYKGAKEELPTDAPVARGKGVKTTSYVDANLYHDMISGRSVTGILHLFNKTPIDWYSKLQSTVETATFGSEYIATRTCTEQIIDLRNTLRYMGVPVNGVSMMFGDNESVVNTASIPHSKLHKCHNALSYHRTREAIAAGITRYHHVEGNMNPADILSKHWDLPSVYPSLRPFLFWRGDTAVLIDPKIKPHHGDTPEKVMTPDSSAHQGE